MNRTLYTEGLDQSGAGFFLEPISLDDPKLQADPRKDAWLQAQEALRKATLGDFSGIAPLVDLYDSDDLGLAGVCYQLLGHAGNSACFSRMRDMVGGPELDWEGKIDFCLAMATGDTLSAVPLIVATYASLWSVGAEGVEMIPHVLCRELEARPERLAHPDLQDTGPAHDDLDAQVLRTYENAVLSRHQELAQHFGTDRVHVDHGEQFGVVALAQRMLRDIGAGEFHWIGPARLRFEASTGIDCRAFFDNRSFKPLRAAAIVEEFLDSPRARYFEPGVRYFFGHPIPD